MRKSLPRTDVHVIGPATQQFVVRANTSDKRPWLAKAPVCSALEHHQIAHTGVANAAAPFCAVRIHTRGSYFLACFGGMGEILVDGRWRRCRAGMAFLLPPYVMNAIRAIRKASWEYCWVRYQQPPEQHPLATNSSPVFAAYDPLPLRSAIWGLYYESLGQASPAACHNWAELIEGYVLRFAQPRRKDHRVWRLWENVATRLSEDWTLDKLAAEVHVSPEHLRRLCRHSLGRSPMQQVTYLRMQRAAKLLAETQDKIGTIAEAVGYGSAFAFSATFKKWISRSPSEHRAR